MTDGEKRRVLARAAAYRYDRESRVLYRRLGAGTGEEGCLWREVPTPCTRADIVREIHEKGGHFGRRRTTYMVMLKY